MVLRYCCVYHKSLPCYEFVAASKVSLFLTTGICSLGIRRINEQTAMTPRGSKDPSLSTRNRSEVINKRMVLLAQFRRRYTANLEAGLGEWFSDPTPFAAASHWVDRPGRLRAGSVVLGGRG